MASKKLTWLLLLQGWTMLWVVIGHAPLSFTPPSELGLDSSVHELAMILFSFAYSFHMPLFIMISGYLFYRTRIVKGWKYLDMVKEKWLRLGIPYIVFISLAILLKFLMPGEVGRGVDVSPMGLAMNYIAPFNGALQEMWFVAVIFIYFLLYPIYPYLLKNKWTMLATLAVSVGLYYIPLGKMTDFFALNRAVHFFIYFFIGLIVSNLNLEQVLAKWQSIVLSSLLYGLSYFIKLAPAQALSASLAFWGLAIVIDKALTDNIFHSFRNYTYQIFLIGIFAQIAVKSVYGRFSFTGSYLIFYLICIFVGVYVPVLISKMAEKTNNKFILRIFGL